MKVLITKTKKTKRKHRRVISHHKRSSISWSGISCDHNSPKKTTDLGHPGGLRSVKNNVQQVYVIKISRVGLQRSKLMIWLRKNSQYRNEYPLLLQKKANAILPQGVVVGKVAPINTGIALILMSGVMIQQLEENNEKLAQAFEENRAEKHKK